MGLAQVGRRVRIVYCTLCLDSIHFVLNICTQIGFKRRKISLLIDVMTPVNTKYRQVVREVRSRLESLQAKPSFTPPPRPWQQQSVTWRQPSLAKQPKLAEANQKLLEASLLVAQQPPNVMR